MGGHKRTAILSDAKDIKTIRKCHQLMDAQDNYTA
jgi:hypothetical protein